MSVRRDIGAEIEVEGRSERMVGMFGESWVVWTEGGRSEGDPIRKGGLGLGTLRRRCLKGEPKRWEGMVLRRMNRDRWGR